MQTHIRFYWLIRTAFLSCVALSFANANAQDAPRVHCSPYVNRVNANAKATKTARGLIIAGAGDSIRAYGPYGGTAANCAAYAQVANEYKQRFGNGVNIYVMPLPTQVSFYLPDAARSWSKDERDGANAMFDALSAEVYGVNVFDTLGNHAAEPIYNRTDHHWSPLGAYYAARELARVADVPFRDLSSYVPDTVHRYVGTMYMYTKSPAIKAHPEDFVWYEPQGVDYTTTFTEYVLGSDRKTIVRTEEPKEGNFFRHYKDGAGAAYCTFMGGDSKIVEVNTSTRNGRRLLILKDSFGNALPGYLFYSFERICVVDCRYFKKNLVKFVAEKGITDIVFANCMALGPIQRTINAYRTYLVQ